MEKGVYDDAIFEIIIYLCKKLTQSRIHFKIVGSTALFLLNKLEFDGKLEKYRYMNYKMEDADMFRTIDMLIGINQFVNKNDLEKMLAIFKDIGKIYYTSEKNTRYIKDFHNRDIFESIHYKIDVTHNENYNKYPEPKNIVMNTLIKNLGKCELDIVMYLCNYMIKPTFYPHLLSENIFAIYVDETETFSFDTIFLPGRELSINYARFSIRSIIENCIYYQKHVHTYSDKEFAELYHQVSVKNPNERMLVVKKIIKYFFEKGDVTFPKFLKPKTILFRYLNKNFIKKIIDINVTNVDVVMSQIKDACFCPICMNEILKPQSVFLTRCGHLLHDTCLYSYLIPYYVKVFIASEEGRERVIGENEENERRCPLCRYDEFTIGILSERNLQTFPLFDYYIRERDVHKIPFC